MDTSANAKFELEKRTADHQGSSGLPADWQFAMVLPETAVVGIGPAAPMDTSPCPSVAVVESYSPGFWGHPPVPQSLGFTISGAANSASAAKLTAMSSTGMFLPDVPAALFPALPRFPADSAFIERAARFSCFNGPGIGSFSSLGPTPSTAPYQQPIMDKGKQSVAAAASSKTSHADGRNANVNSIEAAADESSPSDLGAKKRKLVSQDTETEQAQQGTPLSLDTTNGIPEAKVNKTEINSRKSCEKNSKDGPGDSKEGYVHVRARSGQATNSHSLAERVRREKISERMKYLQDLVPGCSKVTGKAVMLDEIINYVQSLQRQVEFLSMKLATVSPRLECNVDNLLAKDFFQSRGGPPSVAGFTGDMAHPLLHPFQQGLLPAGVSGMVNSSDVFRKMMNSQFSTMSGYKDPTMQMQNPWKEESCTQQHATNDI